MTTTRKISKHGLTVLFDRREVFSDDPGAGTPAMVYLDSDNDYCASLNCAQNEGELNGSRGYRELTGQQQSFLNSDAIDELESWVYG